MKLISIRLIFFYLLILISFQVEAQKQIEIQECPQHNESSRVFFKVKSFLTSADRSSHRAEVSATNETVDMIRPVIDVSICKQLNSIINSNAFYSQIDAAPRKNCIKYYYRTDNLYYILWSYKPEFDNRPIMGPRVIFIIVGEDFNKVTHYYY